MAYQMAPIPMTLSDVQGHSHTTSLFKCDFSYSCAAVDKIITDSVHCAAHLQRLSFLWPL